MSFNRSSTVTLCVGEFVHVLTATEGPTPLSYLDNMRAPEADGAYFSQQAI